MSKNEMELIGLIREHDEPEKAMMIAVDIITSFLQRRGSSEAQAVACPPGFDGTNQ